MKKIKIYHNPKCSKSRQTLDLLKAQNEDPEIIEYLKNPPSLDELENILKMLKMRAEDLLRKGENEYKELEKKYGKPDEKTATRWMIEFPKLMERPIVVNGNKAKLGRPPESVKDIL